ncbi:MAG: VirB4-like conjugal transfer ATPase, CD1110 family [Oscillospiraceae bacterium]
MKYQNMFEDGICDLGNNKYSKTVKFSDINYQIAQREEQIATFSKYCEFLNYFDSSIDVQLTIKNRNVDEEEFKKNMVLKLKQDNLDLYRNEYNSIITDKTLQGQNSISREKYLTFTIKAENYKNSIPILSRLETDITNNFKNLGCDVKSMSGKERLELIYEEFNPSDKFEFNYRDILYSNLQTKDYISPASFDLSNKQNIKINENRFIQTLFFKDLPPDLNDKLISELSDISINMSINLHINSVDQAQAFNLVKRKISFMEQQKINEQQKALKSGYDVDMIPYELKYSLNEAQQLLDDLQHKNQRMFKATILISTSAKTENELRDNIYKIKGVANKNNCKISSLDYMQEEALNSSLLLGENHIEIQRTLTTASTGIFIPFTTQELFHKTGLYYGLNPLSHNLIFVDRKSLKNANGWILGSSGSGKSFTAKREILFNYLLSSGDDVIIIDPEREYNTIAKAFGGEVANISAGSKTHINPFDITMNYSGDDDPLLLKSEYILSLCEILVGSRNGLTAIEKTVIDRCCKLTYLHYFNNPKKHKTPTLEDFYNVLKKQPEKEAAYISSSLELYVKGSLSVFSNATNIDLDNRLVVFDIKDLGKQLKTLGILVVLDHIMNKITSNREKQKNTWIYVDEIHLLFKNVYSENYLTELWKMVRKYGGIMTGITQNAGEVLASENAKLMIANSEFILMLDQFQQDRECLAKILNISDKQLSYITNADVGTGLIYAGNAIVPFVDKFPNNTKFYDIMTTKIDDAKKIDKVVC